MSRQRVNLICADCKKVCKVEGNSLMFSPSGEAPDCFNLQALTRATQPSVWYLAGLQVDPPSHDVEHAARVGCPLALRSWPRALVS